MLLISYLPSYLNSKERIDISVSLVIHQVETCLVQCYTVKTVFILKKVFNKSILQLVTKEKYKAEQKTMLKSNNCHCHCRVR